MKSILRLWFHCLLGTFKGCRYVTISSYGRFVCRQCSCGYMPAPHNLNEPDGPEETTMSKVRVPELDAPEKGCCIAWWAEYQKAALLLERLAEDHFPDQETFDAWMNFQTTQALRGTR